VAIVPEALQSHCLTQSTKRTTTILWRLAVIAGLFALAAIWQGSLSGRWLDLQAIAAWERSVQNHPLAPLLIVAAYVMGGAVLFPVTVLTAITILTFGPLIGNLYGIAGWLASASVGFWVGRCFGADWLRALLGARYDRLQGAAAKTGFLTVLGLRVLPVAPFTVVNLLIGSSRIRFGDFILGSMVGRIPGLLAFTVLTVQFRRLLESGSLLKIFLAAACVVLVFAGQRWFSRQLVAATVAADPRL